MNKTVNINLGGMFFHIDEDAYQKLTRYFDAIKRSLSNSNGQDEIIRDIEMRIAELVSEKHTNDKQVINVREIDEVITVMGQPEDYRIEDDSQPASTQYDSVKRRKKLYRDTEKGMLGGVATGLGHYFGIDAVWIKIMFLIFVFVGFGTGVVAYIILWAITPVAVTTAEKLEMTGEPVTISNIEKKVREEFDNVSERFKNSDYAQAGTQFKSGAEKFASGIGDVFSSIFKIFAKFLGAIIIVFSAVMLVGAFVAMFTLSSTSMVEMPWQNYANSLNFTDYPIWIIGVLGFLSIGIPLFFLFVLGLKLLVNNLKSIGSIAKYTLLAVWLIAVALLITLGIKQAGQVAFDGKTIKKETLNLAATDTIFIKFRYNDAYSKNVEDRQEYLLIQDESNTEQLYSNNIGFHIIKTDEKQAYLQIERKANGKSLTDARQTAEQIKYLYKIEGNQIVLDNYLLTNSKNKYRDQQVEIFLYLPEGTILKPDSSVQNYDWSDDEYFNLHYSGNYIYKVAKDKIKCLDCPADENEFQDLESDGVGGTKDTIYTTTVNVDGNKIEIKTDANGNTITTNVSGTEKGGIGLKVGENGVIVKNQ